MQLQSAVSVRDLHAFEVWVANMIDLAERAALGSDESAALKRHQLQTAEMVRQRIACAYSRRVRRVVGSSRCCVA